MKKPITWSLVEMKASDLKPNPNNPKKRDDKGFERLKKSLSKFGKVFDGIVNKDMSLIDDHSRLEINGTDKVKVFVPSRLLTEKEYKEMNAVFDIAKAGESDIQILEETFTDEFFEEWQIDRGKKIEAVEDSFDGMAPKKPITKLGDLYELNDHRVQCGDSCDSEVVKKTLNGCKPILMVTDPPYGVNYDPEWRKKAGVNKNDGKMGKVKNDDRVDWAPAWALFPGTVGYVWHAGRYASEVQLSLESANFSVVCQIIWAKDRLALSRGDYHWQHEPCWYVIKSKRTHNWTGGRSQTTLWNIKSRENSGIGHSTQKPLECMARPIRNNTNEGQQCYDPFLGSGTTIIAADQLNRVCYGQELAPNYCDVIVARYIKYRRETGGSLTIKRNGRQLNDKEIQKYLDNTNAEK
jgi:DNA modification methylase